MEILLNWLPLDTLSLLERGGMILLLILLLSLLMWSLIIYLYLHIWWR
ncbi:MAG: biopolymer transporter ExbB, partial [gamma proteobacterium symbiont of Stewartia floridana]